MLGKWNKENKAKEESMQHDFIDVAHDLTECLQGAMRKDKRLHKRAAKTDGHYSKTDTASA